MWIAATRCSVDVCDPTTRPSIEPSAEYSGASAIAPQWTATSSSARSAVTFAMRSSATGIGRLMRSASLRANDPAGSSAFANVIHTRARPWPESIVEGNGNHSRHATMSPVPTFAKSSPLHAEGSASSVPKTGCRITARRSIGAASDAGGFARTATRCARPDLTSANVMSVRIRSWRGPARGCAGSSISSRHTSCAPWMRTSSCASSHSAALSSGVAFFFNGKPATYN